MAGVKQCLFSLYSEMITIVLYLQVLDAGRIHAYDQPYNLLQDTEGIFFKMVQQTGKQEAAALLAAAKRVSLNRVCAKRFHLEPNLTLFTTSLFRCTTAEPIATNIQSRQTSLSLRLLCEPLTRLDSSKAKYKHTIYFQCLIYGLGSIILTVLKCLISSWQHLHLSEIALYY